MQPAFAAALLDPVLPPPADITAPSDITQRFNVYRNNVAAGLVHALAAGFPATERIVGAEFFAAMAQDYIRTEPPRSPVLLHYGESFPDFIAGFAPAASRATPRRTCGACRWPCCRSWPSRAARWPSC